MVSAQTCTWKHSHMLMGQILETFGKMVPVEKLSGACLSNHSLPDIKSLYQIQKAESAAIAVSEVFNQTLQFYRTNQKTLDYEQRAQERLEQLLHDQQVELSDCIPGGSENQLFIKRIRQRFVSLQKILEEQEDKLCAQTIVHSDIRTNLLLTAQLSFRMRRLRLLKKLP
ncbi:interferon beta-like [Hyperolius riggenbachi]|uniref:interferon beta-like n=1 Tax=Hyperolius riggenbachi TaxID=752182 RepID=UPI0035A3080C